MIHNNALLTACDKVAQRCPVICGGYHSSSWLFNKLMRFFESNTAAVSVTIPVHINLVGEGEATIGRDGSLVLTANH